MKTPATQFIVYMATNTVNRKRYVGATRKGIDGRRDQHFKDARRKTRDCPRFYDAIRKYGRDVFEWTTLATLSTAEEMYREEERLIALLKPEYNISSGGLIFISKEKQTKFSADGALRSCKPVICLNDGVVYPSASAAALVYNIGNYLVGDICRRGGIARNGLSFAFHNGPMSEFDREKVLSERRSHKIEAERARIKKIADKISRPVTDLNTGVVYDSATVADRILNLVPGTAEACCRRERATRRGECFAFGQLPEPERQRLLAVAVENRRAVDIGWKQKIGKNNSRIVICENTRKLYDNPKAAAIELGLSPDTIYTHCRSGKITQSGLTFFYLDEWCPNPE